ncbi:MAG: flagellar protein FlgN [Gammaproteobacteria bacterium]|nr:flagellar protein FlgN [Gammaproteobacteria bacterium]
MSTPQAHHPLHQVLSKQSAVLGQLLQLLAAEKELLVHPSLDANTALAERKSRCLAELESSMTNLRVFLGENNPKATIGLVQLLARADTQDHAALSTLWQEIKDRLSRCQAMNLANGRAINLASRTLERNLRLLKGQPVDTDIYAANGRTKSLGGYRSSQAV